MKSKNMMPFMGNDLSSSFNDLWNMREQMNRLFENTLFGNGFSTNRGLFPNLSTLPSVFGQSGTTFPSIDVSENDKRLTIKAELPGLDERDITIETNRNQLTIRGEKKQEREDEEGTFHMKEISYGKFSRSITLPFDVDPSDAKASFSNGLLEVSIKKPAEMISKPHTISIKNNNR